MTETGSVKRLLLALGIALVLAVAGEANAQDVSGTWNLTFGNDGGPNGCAYSGTGTFRQSATTSLVTGNVSMTKTAGNATCPAGIEGPLDPASGISGASFVWLVQDPRFAGGIVIVDNTVAGALPGDTLTPTVIPNATDFPPTIIFGTLTGTRLSGPPPPPHYVLDGFGGVHAGDGAPTMSPATPYFGFDVAVDMELAANGYYVLDALGGVHAGGGALLMAPPTPYFGFPAAANLELNSTGYYVLDTFGIVHAGGGAPAIASPTPYFGFDVARDLEIR